MVGGALQLSNDFLLDTGIIIRYLRNTKQAADLLDFLEDVGEISVSAVTYLEILIGCRPHEEESVGIFFERVPPLAITQEIAGKGASLIKKYPSAFGKGVGRGTPDALIAATAWQRRAILVTLNTRQYTRVPITEFEIQAIEQQAQDWVSQLKT